MRKFLVLLFVMYIFVGFSTSASAAIINGGNINGFDTFVDQNTGYVWMDIDSFSNLSTTQMITQANNAGFTFAAKADVEELLSSLPLGSNEWHDIYKPFMGDSATRELIWGSYDDGGSDNYVGWAFAFSYHSAWDINDDITTYNEHYPDMGIWAYSTPVPIPSSIVLLGFGILGLAGVRRKKQN